MMRFIRHKHPIAGFFIVGALVLGSVFINPHLAAADCAALPTDRGTVTSTVNIPATGSYRVWSRIKTADSTKNSFLMQADQAYCNVNIGGVSLSANTWTWVDYYGGSTSQIVAMNLAAGNHTITMAGNADGVEVDRVIFTQDTNCVPTGTGDNCANPPDATPPIGQISSPADSASVTGTVPVTVTASDDVAVTGVDIYDGSTKLGSATLTSGAGASGTWTYSWNTSALTVGSSHPLTAHLTDGTNPVTSASHTVTIKDVTPPTITAIASSSVTQTTATVTWTTNEAGDSQVEYGPTTAYGSSTTLNSSRVTAHSTGVSGLSASTTYHYRVKSKDAAGNLATSGDATFTTQAPASDTTKPVVTMTAPGSGTTVSGTKAVSATASDNVGVVGVQFKLDGANLGAEDTTASGGSYSTNWNTTVATNGTHTLTAVARDAAGNSQTATNVTVTVNNTYIPEDINQDGVVDIRDFSLLSTDFNHKGAAIKVPRTDINGDGVVDIRDFSRLASKF